MCTGLDQTPIEIVLFEVGGQRFGLRSIHVREIVRAATLSEAPRAHSAVIGLLNLRGQAAAVYDLRRFLRLPDTPLEHTEHLIVVQVGERPMAIRADRAVELVQLPAGSVKPATNVVQDWTAVAGVARVADRLVLLLEPGRLLTPEADR